MKTILIDAWKTFVDENGTSQDIYNLLEMSFSKNPKIILTNANDEEIKKYGLDNMPYEVFTLKHNPDKVNPEYYKRMLEHFNLSKDDVVYFEHGKEAVESARSVGIKTYCYDSDKKDLESLKDFLYENIPPHSGATSELGDYSE